MFHATGPDDLDFTNDSIYAERIVDRLPPVLEGGRQTGTGSEDGTDQTLAR